MAVRRRSDGFKPNWERGKMEERRRDCLHKEDRGKGREIEAGTSTFIVEIGVAGRGVWQGSGFSVSLRVSGRSRRSEWRCPESETELPGSSLCRVFDREKGRGGPPSMMKWVACDRQEAWPPASPVEFEFHSPEFSKGGGDSPGKKTEEKGKTTMDTTSFTRLTFDRLTWSMPKRRRLGSLTGFDPGASKRRRFTRGLTS